MTYCLHFLGVNFFTQSVHSFFIDSMYIIYISTASLVCSYLLLSVPVFTLLSVAMSCRDYLSTVVMSILKKLGFNPSCNAHALINIMRMRSRGAQPSGGRWSWGLVWAAIETTRERQLLRVRLTCKAKAGTLPRPTKAL